MNKKANAYKSRRVQSALRGGYKRIGIEPSPSVAAKLRVSLGKLWDKSLGKPCPLLCGRKLTPKLSAFCHDHALSQGGKHQISNIFLACNRCNRAQRTLLKSQYLELQAIIIGHFGQDLWVKIRAWLAGSRF